MTPVTCAIAACKVVEADGFGEGGFVASDDHCVETTSRRAAERRSDADHRSLCRLTYEKAGFRLIVDEVEARALFNETERAALKAMHVKALAALMAASGAAFTTGELKTAIGSRSESSVRNLVSDLRRELAEHKHLIETAKDGYRFTGAVEVIELAQADADLQTLVPGDHFAPIPGHLREKIYYSHGVECWVLEGTAANPGFWRARIAVSDLGRRRLEREAAAHHFVSELGAGSEISIAPVEALHPSLPAALAWPFEARSLQWRAENAAFFASHGEAARLTLFGAIVNKVAALHEAGVVHGDLKPSNLYFEHDGAESDVRLCGFAHAVIRPTADDGRLSLTPSVQETDWRRRRPDSEDYRAPELSRALGEPASVTPTSDAYALGVMLFRLILGDFGAPFTANWQERVSDPALRMLIEGATATDPVARWSAQEIARSVRNIDVRRAALAREEEALEDIRRRQQARERARIRLPWQRALAFSLAIAAAALSVQNYFLHASRDTARTAAAQAASSRDFLENTLLAADPRTPGVDKDASVRDVLGDAVERTRMDFAQAPEARLETLFLIARIQRGLSDFDGQRDTLAEAVAAADAELPTDYRTRAKARYLLAHNLIQTRPRADETAQILKDTAETLIGEADRLSEGPEQGRSISGDITLLAAYVKGQQATFRNDFVDVETILEPAVISLQSADRGLTRNEYNPVILFAQAQFRNGKPREALGTLKWLETKDQSRGLPSWLILNRRTLTAQISGILQAPNARRQFETTLAEFINLYGTGDAREGGLRSYYGDYLAAIGEFEDALTELTRAHETLCSIGLGPIYCQGTRASIGSVKLSMGDYDGAIADFTEVRAAFEAIYPDGALFADYHLAAAYFGAGAPNAAAPHMRDFDPAVLNSVAPGSGWPQAVELLSAVGRYHANPTEMSVMSIEKAVSRFAEAGGNPAAVKWATAAIRN